MDMIADCHRKRCEKHHDPVFKALSAALLPAINSGSATAEPRIEVNLRLTNDDKRLLSST